MLIALRPFSRVYSAVSMTRSDSASTPALDRAAPRVGYLIVPEGSQAAFANAALDAQASGGDDRTRAAAMQVAGWLADGVDDCAVAAAGHRAGLALRPVSPYWVGPGARPGLHLGYAALSESAMEPPVRQLARIIERGSRPSAAGGR